MNNSVSREEILSRIKKAKTSRKVEELSIPDMISPIYKKIETSILTCFKSELEIVSGVCDVCKSLDEVAEKIKQLLKDKNTASVFCKDSQISSLLDKYHISYLKDVNSFESMQIGITGCEFLVARTGSVIVSSQGKSGRQMNIFPPIHVVIAKKEQLIELPEDGLVSLQKKYEKKLPSLISFISGPSRTADIEKTLVLGAHGPRELYVFIYE